MSYGFIYKIVCLINKKIYVGQTTNLIPKNRWLGHCSAARAKSKLTDCPITRAIRKYGKQSFEFSIIEECENQLILDEREIYFILNFNSRKPNGYNLQIGGRGGKHHISSIEKMSLAKRGNKHPMYGKQGYWKGKSLSDKTKQKLSLSLLGKKQSEEHKINSGKSKGRIIRQYSLDNKFIAEFYSACEAARKCKVRNPSYVANGERRQAGGFYWKWADQDV